MKNSMGLEAKLLYARPGPAALVHLAAQPPAAVLADLLNLAPTTAVNWVRDGNTLEIGRSPSTG
jgi:hypothetical protein